MGQVCIAVAGKLGHFGKEKFDEHQHACTCFNSLDSRSSIEIEKSELLAPGAMIQTWNSNNQEGRTEGLSV